ncbi:MAG: PDZ domain-containing protein, partial [Emcibacteraceae bacterium]|nr:PDZ domain-containing protein [Emcibacteraceae bacterium]
AESLGFDRPGGVLVDNVYPDSPADRGGLEPGDVVLSINGEEIFDTQGLRYFIGLGKVGGETMLDVMKGDDRRILVIELEKAPEDPPRNLTTLDGDHIFTKLEVGNLSPAYSAELGVGMFEKGVIILSVDRASPVRRLNVIRPGDIFDNLDGENINTVDELVRLLDDVDDNDVSFGIRRAGRVVQCTSRGRGSYNCR